MKKNSLPKSILKIEEMLPSYKDELGRQFFERGEALLMNAEDLSSLQEAYSVLENALKLIPSSIKAWTSFGDVNLRIAYIEEDPKRFLKAHEVFTHSENLCKEAGLELPPEALWDWGNCLYWMGKESEEAYELKTALDKYSEAYKKGLSDSIFFLDYGTAMGELGVLVGRQELIIDAANLLKRSIEVNGDNPSSWLRLACAYKILYFLTGDVGQFENADQSFVAAARFNVDPAEPLALWLNWGQLLSLEGKTTRDPELLISALEKLEKADLIQQDDPIVLTAIGDTLMHIGILEDKYDFLKESIATLELACSLAVDYPDPFCLLGHALANMGKYFSDASYVHKAIEKFQMGISQDKESHHFWHGLATACFILAEMTHKEEDYLKATKFCEEAIKVGGDIPGYWNDWGVALMKLGELVENSGHLFEAVQKFEEAIHCFNRKSGGGTPDPDWFYNYGCALDWIGDHEFNPSYFERSIVILARLIDQYPDFHYARYNLGLACFHLGDVTGEIEPLEQAIEQFQLYIQCEPEDDTVMSDLGLTYLTLGDLLQESIENERSIACFKAAEIYLLKSLALGSGRSNYYLACLHSINGNFPEAMIYLQRAAKLKVMPPLEDVLQDEWLGELRLTPQFQIFLKGLPPQDPE